MKILTILAAIFYYALVFFVVTFLYVSVSHAGELRKTNCADNVFVGFVVSRFAVESPVIKTLKDPEVREKYFYDSLDGVQQKTGVFDFQYWKLSKTAYYVFDELIKLEFAGYAIPRKFNNLVLNSVTYQICGV